jgi:hypothetical protein
MKSDLDFILPGKWMNAAGTAGFIPDKHFISIFPDIALFITNPISYLARKPAFQRNIIPFQGGFLVHNGHPNPGLKKAVQLFRKAWENSPIPICVNLLSDDSDYIEKIVRSVENIDNIVAIELGIDITLNKDRVEKILHAAMGELPIILSLPFEYVYQDWLQKILFPEIVAISIQAPRGVLQYEGNYVHGRLYGNSIFPLTLNAVQHLSSIGKPIFAGAGVFCEQQISMLLETGASNLQVHELVWRNNI